MRLNGRPQHKTTTESTEKKKRGPLRKDFLGLVKGKEQKLQKHSPQNAQKAQKGGTWL
jgi:hypothetical protein